MTPRTQETKEHINWTTSNLEATYASKDTISSVKKKLTKMEKIFVNHASEKKLIYRNPNNSTTTKILI